MSSPKLYGKGIGIADKSGTILMMSKGALSHQVSLLGQILHLRQGKLMLHAASRNQNFSRLCCPGRPT